MIQFIISKIKEFIKQKITFHKRIMFVGSLYGCLVNHKQDDFINEVTLLLDKENKLSLQAIKIIKKEMRFILHQEIPFNPDMLIDAKEYKTKPKPKYALEISEYFASHPISTVTTNIIENLYIDSLVTKQELVHKELVALVHGMNIHVSSSATKLPLFLHNFWWDYSQFGKVVEDTDNIERMVERIYMLSPYTLKYDDSEQVRKDIKNIVTFIKEKL